ncbi:hypothetical protein [Wolbachia endosymbiont of Chironomus riparius]|uniref:hypothetical protein n=1 Tax=Wolbachia endosymbiont of Chironomus riparius TaxID=2883238 RepID=UPI0020A20800|nr:hypothetical protein [Wolbachia endosymbiont of Chironomus riparius]
MKVNCKKELVNFSTRYKTEFSEAEKALTNTIKAIGSGNSIDINKNFDKCYVNEACNREVFKEGSECQGTRNNANKTYYELKQIIEKKASEDFINKLKKAVENKISDDLERKTKFYESAIEKVKGKLDEYLNKEEETGIKKEAIDVTLQEILIDTLEKVTIKGSMSNDEATAHYNVVKNFYEGENIRNPLICDDNSCFNR